MIPGSVNPTVGGFSPVFSCIFFILYDNNKLPCAGYGACGASGLRSSRISLAPFDLLVSKSHEVRAAGLT